MADSVLRDKTKQFAKDIVFLIYPVSFFLY